MLCYNCYYCTSSGKILHGDVVVDVVVAVVVLTQDAIFVVVGVILKTPQGPFQLLQHITVKNRKKISGVNAINISGLLV